MKMLGATSGLAGRRISARMSWSRLAASVGVSGGAGVPEGGDAGPHSRGQDVGPQFDLEVVGGTGDPQRGIGPALLQGGDRAARKLAGQLRELRNTYGTGHGRPALPIIEDEVLETCVDGALLWTRWALRRLQCLLIGDLQPLLADLRGSTFRRGDLATRLQAANQPDLPPDDQRLLGVAVGQRAALNTFTVRIDGVEACATREDVASWPPDYREGVAEGLFLDHFGQIRVDEEVRGPRLAAEVLGPHPEQARAVSDLETKLASAAWSPELPRQWQQVVAEMRLAQTLLQPPEAQQAWSNIAERLTQTGQEYEAIRGQ
jgi:hypothetical protein